MRIMRYYMSVPTNERKKLTPQRAAISMFLGGFIVARGSKGVNMKTHIYEVRYEKDKIGCPGKRSAGVTAPALLSHLAATLRIAAVTANPGKDCLGANTDWTHETRLPCRRTDPRITAAQGEVS